MADLELPRAVCHQFPRRLIRRCIKQAIKYQTRRNDSLNCI